MASTLLLYPKNWCGTEIQTESWYCIRTEFGRALLAQEQLFQKSVRIDCIINRHKLRLWLVELVIKCSTHLRTIPCSPLIAKITWNYHWHLRFWWIYCSCMFKLKRVWAFALSYFSPIFFAQNMAKHLIVGYFQQREERHENNIDVKLCVVLTTTRACNNGSLILCVYFNCTPCIPVVAHLANITEFSKRFIFKWRISRHCSLH